MEIVALILSTLVSIVAISTTAYQAYLQRNTEITKLYFTSQLDAYTALLEEAANLEVNHPIPQDKDFTQLIAAGQKAMLISTHRNAEIISHFCAVYMDFISKEDLCELNDSIIAEFQDAKFMMTTVLREELFRFDTMRRKSDKYFNENREN